MSQEAGSDFEKKKKKASKGWVFVRSLALPRHLQGSLEFPRTPFLSVAPAGESRKERGASFNWNIAVERYKGTSAPLVQPSPVLDEETELWQVEGLPRSLTASRV